MSILSRLGKQLLAVAVSISLLSSSAFATRIVAPVKAGSITAGSAVGAAGASIQTLSMGQINVNLGGLSAQPAALTSQPSAIAPQSRPLNQAERFAGLAAPSAGLHLHHNKLMTAGPNAADSFAAEAAMRQTDRVAGAAVQAHPVIAIINELQKAGVNVSDMPKTDEEVEAFKAAVQNNLPNGPARQSMLAFANAISLTNGVSGKGELDRVWDNVAGPYKDAALLPKAEFEVAAPAVSGWTQFWAGRKRGWFGLKAAAQKQVKAAAEKARADARADAKTVAIEKLTVPQSKLRYVPDEAELPESTEDVAFQGDKIFGQDRGMESLEFGMRKEGTHVILTGADGTGRITAVRQIAGEVAPTRPTPKDIVSATNVADRDKPVILRLASGNGGAFKATLEKSIAMLKQTLPQMLGSGRIAEKKKQLHAEWEQQSEAAQKAFNERLAAIRHGRYGIALMQANEHGTAFQVVVTIDGKVYDDQETAALIEREVGEEREDKVTQEAIAQAKEAMQPKIEEISGELQAMLGEINQTHQQVHQQMDQLDQQAVGGIINQFGSALYALTEDEAYSEFRLRMKKRREAVDAEIAKVKILNFFGLEIVDRGDGQLSAFPTFTDPRAAQLGPIAAQLGLGAVPIQNAEMLEALKSQVDGIGADLTWEKLAEATLAKAKHFEGAFTEMHRANKEDHDTLPAASREAQQAGAYVKALMQHMAENYQEFLPQQLPEGIDPMMAAMLRAQHEDPAQAYKVTVLATNQPGSGAPVVFEPSPSFKRVFGVAEDGKQIMMMGGQAVKKDAPGGPKLKSGSLVRANGGYLVMDVMDVLREPNVYQALMRMLRNKTAEIAENGVMSIYTESDVYDVPIDVKVVLIGSPYIKMMLRHYDEDFARMFKAAAEFQDAMRISKDAIEGYLKFMRKMVEISGGKMLHFARSAIAATIEAAARGADSNEELTARFGPVNELMSESSYWADIRLNKEAAADAAQSGRTVAEEIAEMKQNGEWRVAREDVEKASSERLEREGSMKNRLYDLYAEGSFKLDVAGDKVGAVTGMAVMGQFGIPAKITVRRSLNRGGEPLLISTEKNAALTGSSFEQSVGNITGFFEQLFGELSNWPLKARVKFEQNYGGIDGDSATQTMIYAVLSSWADVPLKQGIAITGSADQEGNVQVIGGLKHKIEGTWDVTVAKFRQDHGREPTKEDGLGIIFPADNIRQLALRPDVALAVEEGRLNLYPVTHISQGIEILTGQPYSVVLDKAKENAGKARLAALTALKEAKEAMGE